jgi:hypothetical protein
MSAPACLICGGQEAEQVLAFSEPDVYEKAVGLGTAGYFRRWVRCRTCGFHASQYSRPADLLDRLYQTTYRDTNSCWRTADTRGTFKKVVALPVGQSETKSRIAWIKGVIAEQAQSGLLGWEEARPNRLLDIGGATGVFAYEFQDTDWASTIIDPADSGRFVTEYGVTYECQAYRPGLFRQPFHLISLVFTLEHLRDPLGLLTAIRQDLVQGGLVYVEVPDAAAFRLKSPEDDIFNSTHLWMFDPLSLVTLMGKAGLQISALRRMQTRRGHYALVVLGSTS